MATQPNARRRGRRSRSRTLRRVYVSVAVVAVLMAAWSVLRPPRHGERVNRIAPVQFEPARLPTPALSDDELQRAADGLLQAVDPERPENAYLPQFALEKLRWMVQEHADGRLEVAFLSESATGSLPDDVLMAAWRVDGMSTIMISKRRFASFLREGGATIPPFSQQQKNDFAIGLVHEILHLQNLDANPRDAALRAAEESRAWHQVTIHVVRPLRARNEPMHPRFRQVDDALRACRDQLPCPLMGRLVRLRL